MGHAKASRPQRPLSGRSRRRRERAGLFVVLGLGAVAAALAAFLRELDAARAIIVREDRALEVLWRVRRAESAFQAAEGRYGWISDLVQADLLADLDVVEEGGRTYVREDGYRIDVLLPQARLGPEAVGIVPQGGSEAVDPRLAARHVSVVARPLDPGVSGHRMWYVDERDELYLNEGVVDDVGAKVNEFPRIQVRRAHRLDTARYLLWQRAADVPDLTD